MDILLVPLPISFKKGSFQWNNKVEGAFKLLKQAMTTTPTLAKPNFNDSFIVDTNKWRNWRCPYLKGPTNCIHESRFEN